MQKNMVITMALLISSIAFGSDHGSERESKGRHSPIAAPISSLKEQHPIVSSGSSSDDDQESHDSENEVLRLPASRARIKAFLSALTEEDTSAETLKNFHEQSGNNRIIDSILEMARENSNLAIKNYRQADRIIRYFETTNNILVAKLDQARLDMDALRIESDAKLQKEKSGWRRKLINLAYFTTGVTAALTTLTVYCIATGKLKLATPQIAVNLPTLGTTPVTPPNLPQVFSITPQITLTPAPITPPSAN